MNPEFGSNGLLRIKGAIDVDDIASLKAEFWREIDERFAIVESDRASWFSGPNKAHGDHRGRRLAGMNPVMEHLKNTGAFDAVESALRRVVDGALGPEPWVLKPKWYSLLSFPAVGSGWNVPHQSWHADEPAAAGHSLPWSVFAFVFLAPVPRRGGGTVVVTGSHRCAERLARRAGQLDPVLVNAFAQDNDQLVDAATLKLISPIEIAQRLADEAQWFQTLLFPGPAEQRIAELMDRESVVDGVPVKVVEVSGAPGDVVLLDPRCLHSVSRNAFDLPRQVVRVDFRRVPRAERRSPTAAAVDRSAD